MRIIVEPHICKIDKTPVNEKEINVTKVYFNFSEEITNEFVKEAYFTYNGNSYKQIIVNNECDIPNEVLQEKGSVELGVVAKLVDLSDKTIKQYNPSPCYFDTWKGSLKEAENSEPITPTDKEQMEQAIQNVTNQMNNLDIDAEKIDNTTTITITKKDGTEKTTEVDDGIDGTGLDYNWSGTSLGVKREDETNYQYVNLQGPQGAPGSIRMVIVNSLPETGEEGTLYFVPKTPDTSDLYDEYVWINNAWELLGEKQIVVDLSDYYKKEETYSQAEVNALIPDLTDYVKNTDYATTSKGGVIKTANSYGTAMSSGTLIGKSISYSDYGSAQNLMFISKGTLENVITGKGLVSNTIIKNTNSTTAGDVYDVRYINSLIGDIDSALDTLNGEEVS